MGIENKKAGIYVHKGLLVINYNGWSQNNSYENVEIIEKSGSKIIVKGDQINWGIIWEFPGMDITKVEDEFIEEIKGGLFGLGKSYKRIMLNTPFRYKQRTPETFESNHYLIIT